MCRPPPNTLMRVSRPDNFLAAAPTKGNHSPPGRSKSPNNNDSSNNKISPFKLEFNLEELVNLDPLSLIEVDEIEMTLAMELQKCQIKQQQQQQQVAEAKPVAAVQAQTILPAIHIESEALPRPLTEVGDEAYGRFMDSFAVDAFTVIDEMDAEVEYYKNEAQRAKEELAHLKSEAETRSKQHDAVTQHLSHLLDVQIRKNAALERERDDLRANYFGSNTTTAAPSDDEEDSEGSHGSLSRSKKRSGSVVFGAVVDRMKNGAKAAYRKMTV
ncbi:hypothetical protein HDU97_008189 [Phlyctochytrium planicorne]|nr:hypothetical protein HDU97_008189 [Phlyctochytrium planicorne]